MEKKDRIILIFFIFLVISIILVVGINSYKTRKLKNIDRKIEYILGYSYDTVLNKGEELFFQGLRLINDKDAFEYERNLNNSIKTYAIENVNNYIKIKNFSLATNTFSNNALKEFMDFKNIIYYENNYYMENFKNKESMYIGSYIDIDSYNNDKIYFKSINYYCDNYEYIGSIIEEPKCEYITKETKFIIEIENNIFRIASIKDILNIK